MALAPNLAWLFVGRVISGITAASVSTGMAYIADVTPPEKRAGAFGMIGVAFGLGFVLGPALGGLLGTRRSAAAVLGRRGASASRTRLTACSCCPNRCRPRGAGRSSGAGRTRSARSGCCARIPNSPGSRASCS